MTLERAVQVLQLRQRWRESERKDRLQCWPGSQAEINSIEESQAVDVVLTAIAALEAQKDGYRTELEQAIKDGVVRISLVPSWQPIETIGGTTEDEPVDNWLWEFVLGGCGRFLGNAGRRQCGQRGTTSSMVAYVYCLECRGPAEMKIVDECDRLRIGADEAQTELAAVRAERALVAPIIVAAIQWNEDGEPEALEAAMNTYQSSPLTSAQARD